MQGRQCSTRLRVVAWGRSVLASALVAGLATRTEFDLVQVEATLPAALGALRNRRAHAVVCDLGTVPAACVLALFEAHTQLLVVIVDPDADHAMALTCRRTPMRTMDDLVVALLDVAGGNDDLPPDLPELP